MRHLFISDLHLHESRPLITRAFFHFLDEQTRSQDQLYILGDFFDAWIGDDDDDPFALDIINALNKTSQRATIYFLHGNRDFLIGDKFAKNANVKLLTEPTRIQLLGEDTLLMHGDTLCTDDLEYQQFRAMVRSPQWQAQVLAQPLATRRALAAQLREKSQHMNSLKAVDIMDVNESEILRVMREFKVTRLIHGHTHRPQRHSIVVDEKKCERIVLGDWHDYGWALMADRELQLIHWSII